MRDAAIVIGDLEIERLAFYFGIHFIFTHNLNYRFTFDYQVIGLQRDVKIECSCRRLAERQAQGQTSELKNFHDGVTR